MTLHLVVGLGNPGPRYEATRHNVGAMVVERLAERWGLGGWRPSNGCLVAEKKSGNDAVVLAKPQLFMNRSGSPVASLLGARQAALASLLVVHDDLDLPFGALRIRDGGGHGGHNGLRSLLEALGSGEFLRLKLGIGRPLLREDVVDHVLSSFGPEEGAILPALLDRAADAVEAVLVEGPLKAMNRFHS